MKRPFAATVWREGRWYVSQCLELDVASQGDTEEEALANLKEAIELHFEPPQATRPPQVRLIEVEVGASKPPTFPRGQAPSRGGRLCRNQPEGQPCQVRAAIITCPQSRLPSNANDHLAEGAGSGA